MKQSAQMIIAPEKILINKDIDVYNNKKFLILGNEETYINKIEKDLSSKIFQKKNKEINKLPEGTAADEKNIKPFLTSLFHEFKIIIFKNPKIIDFDFIKNFDNSDISIIICAISQKNQNIIKKQFEKQSNCVIISCYKLNRDIKKLYLDDFLNKNNITLSKDGYWFFLDSTSDYYQLFENEMIKLLFTGMKEISIDEIKLLTTRNENHEIEKLFFLILKTPKEILLQTYVSIKSESDSYILLQRSKFFINLLIQCKTTGDAERFFPRYLFREKQSFLSIFKKTNPKKFTDIFALIKKTEITLRKQGVFYNQICQRFMINLSKTIK